MSTKITRDGKELLPRKKIASKNEKLDAVSNKDIDLALSEFGEEPDEECDGEDYLDY